MLGFRGGLVCKAHILLYHSTLGLKVIKKRREEMLGCVYAVLTCGASLEALAALNPIPFACRAARRDKSREWARLKAKVEPLLTLGDSGNPIHTPETRNPKCKPLASIIAAAKGRGRGMIYLELLWGIYM